MKDHAAHQASVPRRSRRQPPAPRGAEGRPRQARARRDHGRAAEGGRGPRDRDVIRKQEEIGLKSITDGEFRRAFWNYDFLGKLDGVEAYLGERKIKFQGPQPKPMMLRVIGKLGTFSGHPMIEHFKFVQANTKQTPKMTIPSPSSLHFRYGRSAVPESDLSGHGRCSTAISARPIARRCAPSPTPAAAICSSTRSTSPTCAIRKLRQQVTRARRRSARSCRTSTPT